MAQLLFFNTRDRISGTNCDATFDLAAAQLTSPAVITPYTVEFPFTVYPIDLSRKNNRFGVNVGGTDYEALIQPGRTYTGDEFAAELQLGLNDIGLGNIWTVTFDAVTGRLTINIGAGTWIPIATERGCYREAGFDPELQTTPAATIEGASPIDLSGTKYVDLYTNLAQNDTWSTNGQHPTSRIPVDVSFGGVVNHQFSFSQDMDASSSAVIRLSLRDDRDLPLVLPTNVDVSYTFILKPPT